MNGLSDNEYRCECGKVGLKKNAKVVNGVEYCQECGTRKWLEETLKEGNDE